MEEKIESIGECRFCDEKFSAKEIRRHLSKHLVVLEKKNTQKSKPFHHILIQGKYDKLMFLHILADSDAPIEAIDEFLREIWLECCGHMSGFYNKREEVDIDTKIGTVFTVAKELIYDYDFGTTTSLTVKALKTYNLPFEEEIVILSRNEALKIMCDGCNEKIATVMCQNCYSENGLLAFCKKCAKKHGKACEDFADYAECSIVNSPRCGQCGYDGGKIDVENDGVYKIEKKIKILKKIPAL
jgi:hypothetical protein